MGLPVPWIFLGIFLSVASALELLSHNGTQSIKLNQKTASFGPQLSGDQSVIGRLVIPTPQDGCSSFDSAFNLAGAVVLLQRGNCTFYSKVERAQVAGAVGVVIGNTAEAQDAYVQMSRSREKTDGDLDGVEVTIPSQFVLYRGYQIIVEKYSTLHALQSSGSLSAEDAKILVVMSREGEVNNLDLIGRSLSLRIATVMLMALPTLWCFLALILVLRRYVMERYMRGRRRRLLVNIPEVIYKDSLIHNHEEELWLVNNSCPICLDDFVDNVTTVKRLGCAHAFHVNCIEPWLANRSDQCPICKRSIFQSAPGSRVCCPSLVRCLCWRRYNQVVEINDPL